MRDGKLTLRSLVVGRKNRSEMIGIFLALLELIRQKRILVVQGDDQSDMEISSAPEEHRSTYVESSPPDSATPQTENA
jgi:chromatin segregation and condensation protein Rec8/ScpA/Scc1 (kleisin family)